MSDVAPIALSVSRGGAKTYNATHQESGTNAVPVDITNWTIKITGRNDRKRVILTKTATIVNGPLGTFTFGVTHADTTLPPGPYDLDIQRIDAGLETLMGLGTLEITKQVLY